MLAAVASPHMTTSDPTEDFVLFSLIIRTGIRRPPDRYRRSYFFAPLRPWPTKPWRSLLCVSFSPLRLCVSFLHLELTRPSCLVVTCIFPAPYTRSCHQLHYPGLSTQITSRLAIAITGARASFPLRRHLASVKAQGRGESKQ